MPTCAELRLRLGTIRGVIRATVVLGGAREEVWSRQRGSPQKRRRKSAVPVGNFPRAALEQEFEVVARRNAEGLRLQVGRRERPAHAAYRLAGTPFDLERAQARRRRLDEIDLLLLSTINNPGLQSRLNRQTNQPTNPPGRSSQVHRFAGSLVGRLFNLPTDKPANWTRAAARAGESMSQGRRP